MANIRLVTDSTCDLSVELKERCNLVVIPLCIVMDDNSYFDMVDVTPDDIFIWADKNKITPKTAAASIETAIEILKPMVENGDDIIYIGISEQMSTTCNVIRLAAAELEYDRVFVVDSMNLSTGIGLQLLRAADLIEQGKTAEEIVLLIEGAREKVRSSFVVDTLTYLARGGRCTAVTALLANTLQLKPRIEVRSGKMGVGQKYRGNYKKVIMKYAQEMTDDLLKSDPKRVFVTYSKMDPEICNMVADYVRSLNYFEEVLLTQAGGVISSHCGPNTLGILYYEA